MSWNLWSIYRYLNQYRAFSERKEIGTSSNIFCTQQQCTPRAWLQMITWPATHAFPCAGVSNFLTTLLNILLDVLIISAKLKPQMHLLAFHRMIWKNTTKLSILTYVTINLKNDKVISLKIFLLPKMQVRLFTPSYIWTTHKTLLLAKNSVVLI